MLTKILPGSWILYTKKQASTLLWNRVFLKQRSNHVSIHLTHSHLHLRSRLSRGWVAAQSEVQHRPSVLWMLHICQSNQEFSLVKVSMMNDVVNEMFIIRTLYQSLQFFSLRGRNVASRQSRSNWIKFTEIFVRTWPWCSEWRQIGHSVRVHYNLNSDTNRY